MRKRASRPHEQVFAVTGLPASLKDDRDERLHRYLLSMGIRTACFILAVITLTVLQWTVLGWAFVIAAVILPYIAVVMANATRSPAGTTLGPLAPDKTPHSDTTGSGTTANDTTDSGTTDSGTTDNGTTDSDTPSNGTTGNGTAPQQSPRSPDEEPHHDPGRVPPWGTNGL